MEDSNVNQVLRQWAEVFAAGRELPEVVGKFAYWKVRQLIAESSHWAETWVDLYERPEDCCRVIELGMAGWENALSECLQRRFTMEQLEAAASDIEDELTAIAADPVGALVDAMGEGPDSDEFSIEDFAEGLLAKPGAAVAWAFLVAVILRHHLAGEPVHATFAKAVEGGCDRAWERLIRIDPMVVNTTAFQQRLARSVSTPGDAFVSTVAKAIEKHESDIDWDTSRQFEAVMRDLVRGEDAKPLRYEDVFLLCEKYGGSSFGDHISLRAEAARARKRIDLKGRSKTDHE